MSSPLAQTFGYLEEALQEIDRLSNLMSECASAATGADNAVIFALRDTGFEARCRRHYDVIEKAILDVLHTLTPYREEIRAVQAALQPRN